MKYKLETKYCWLNDTTNLVLMYFIQGIPFTFDEYDDWFYDYEVIDEANNQPQYDMEMLYKYSSYLIAEECHPMLFDMELENPELLPVE